MHNPRNEQGLTKYIVYKIQTVASILQHCRQKERLSTVEMSAERADEGLKA